MKRRESGTAREKERERSERRVYGEKAGGGDERSLVETTKREGRVFE